MSKHIVITQSNYIPWKGYFDAIRAADVFVEYDDMQYTRRDWRNRNLIKTPQGLHWLTIPVEVKGKFFQSIRDTRISDSKWNSNHWKTISLNYAKAPYFKQYKELFGEMYAQANFSFLTEVNMHFLRGINSFLEITTPLLSSADFDLKEERSERLLHICTTLGGTKYYSGPAAKAYMNEEMFQKSGVEVVYFNYAGYPEYHQQHPPFEHGVSVLDLIFNEGDQAIQFMKNQRIA